MKATEGEGDEDEIVKSIQAIADRHAAQMN